MKDFLCPYDDIGCIHLDTAGMFKMVECYECEHYVKPEEKRKKDYPDPNNPEEMDEWNTFMMGL